MSENQIHNIEIEAYVNEAYAEIYTKLSYTNSSPNPFELNLSLPFQKGLQFVDFEADIEGKKVISKIIPIEKAEEKYNDSIAAGNTSIFVEYKMDLDKYIIHFGNIEPNKKVDFKAHFLQNLFSKDLFYIYTFMNRFPSFNDTDYNILSINAKIKIETFSCITQLEEKILNNTECIPEINKVFNEDKRQCEINLSIKDLKFDINSRKKSLLISFLFQTEEYKKPKLFKQYDPKNDETSLLLSYFKTIKEQKNEEINEIPKSFPGIYYFLIDQSNSMAGKSIELVKQTLKIFILSLPKGSYYQLIGFGTNFLIYSEKLLEYTKENFIYTINIIDQLQGNLGKTNLYEPLHYIYDNSNNKKDNNNLNLKLPKNIFILTDGHLSSNKTKTLELIEKNNNDFQIYAYGIGTDFDRDFISTAGEVGFGSFEFITDIQNMNLIINEQLNKCLKDYYYDVSFNIEINDNKIYEMMYDYYKNEFILENQLVNYYLIVKGKIEENKNININCHYKYEDKQLKDNYQFNTGNVYNLSDGNILSKITIFNLLKKGKDADFSEEKNIKTISKKYQILCQYTSLYAEIENEKSINESLQANQNIIRDNNEISPMNNNKNLYSLRKENSNVSSIGCLFNPDNKGNRIEKKNNNSPGILQSIGGAIYGIFSSLNSSLTRSNNKKIGIVVKSSGFNYIEKLGSKFENNNNSKFSSVDYSNYNQNKEKEKSEDIIDIIITQDIIEGYWEENEKTKLILKKKKEIFDKVKKIVNNNNIAMTFIILNYIINDNKEKIGIFTNIVNKAKLFLANNNYSYETIESKLV